MKVRLANGSGTRDYKHVWADFDRWGNERVYFKRPGEPKVRLREEPGTAEFDAEYQRAFAGEVQKRIAAAPGPAAPDTLSWLCQQYYASAAFQQLAQSTRKVRRGILENICQRAGTFRFEAMRPRDVAKLRDEKAELPDAGNGRVKALRQLFGWASSPEYDHASHNPAKGVAYLRPKNPDGFKVWTLADVAEFKQLHQLGSKPRLALDLLLLSGVRRSDVVRLGPQMERWFDEPEPDGTILRVQKLVFTEYKGRQKGQKIHHLPILPALRASIDATPTGQLAYLVTRHGAPYTAAGFGNWFRRQCNAAGLEDCSAHGLRKLGAQTAAEMGASEHQLMALFGWESTKQAGVYTKKADRALLEGQAIHLLQGREQLANVGKAAAGQVGNKILPPEPAMRSGGSIRRKT